MVGRSEPFETATATAELEAPAEVAAGTSFEIAWDGLGGPGDRIELHVVGGSAEGGAPVAAVRTFTRPATLLAPPEPGAFELRYVTSGSGHVLATAAVAVVEARVEVIVPDVVPADAVFEVAVSGAVGPRDSLVLVRAGAPDAGAEIIGPPRRLYTATVGIRAPAEPGAYEVRYLTGEGEVTQRFPVTVR